MYSLKVLFILNSINVVFNFETSDVPYNLPNENPIERGDQSAGRVMARLHAVATFGLIELIKPNDRIRLFTLMCRFTGFGKRSVAEYGYPKTCLQ